MPNLPPLSQDMKKDLDNKLRKYLRLDYDTRRKLVMFTTRPEIWKTDREPHFITTEPLPPNPSYYDTQEGGICQKVLDYYRWTLAKERLSLAVLVFEFEVDGRVELHIMFSADKSATTKPPEAFVQDQYQQPPNRSTSAPNLRIAYTRGCHISTIDPGAELTKESSSSSAPQSTSSAPTSLRSLMSKCDSAIASRLSEELKRNLDQKLNIYWDRGEAAEHAAVIFTDRLELWKTDRDPVIVTSEPMPPIPPDYDHQNYDIEKDVREYVVQQAAQRSRERFHASSLREGTGSPIHLLFSRYNESAIRYRVRSLRATECPPTVAASAPIITIAAEYREYSSGTASLGAVNFTRTSMMFERRGDSTTPTTISSETSSSLDDSTDDDSTTSDDDETRPIVLRLGSVLKRNLERKMERFVKRSEEEKHASFIFTDDELMWKTNKDPVFVVDPLPPIPSHYDHATFDILADMVAYMRIIAARNSIKPFYVSTVHSNEGSDLQVHILLSQYNEYLKTFCADCRLGETESLPSEAGSAPSVMDSSTDPTTSASFATAVKRRRTDPAEMKRDDSMESIEDLPVDPPPSPDNASLRQRFPDLPPGGSESMI